MKKTEAEILSELGSQDAVATQATAATSTATTTATTTPEAPQDSSGFAWILKDSSGILRHPGGSWGIRGNPEESKGIP